jgi:hypothetical protein
VEQTGAAFIVVKNLLRDSWADLDQRELGIVLKEHLTGSQGQYDGKLDVFYLPLAREQCRVALRYHDDKIVAIEPGEAFDGAQWDAICAEIETSVLKGPRKVGRDISFSTHLVKGSWRGPKSGVQILPPPDNAPLAGEGGENPFILEFSIRESRLWDLKNYRRRREHRKLTLVLNLLLAGTISRLPARSRHFWTNVGGDAGPKMKWVQEWYYADFGNIFLDELSPQIEAKLEVIVAEKYYGIGLDGRGMRVPSDLDDSIYRYQHLPPDLQSKFDRAAYWMSMASRQWTDSMSASFASVVIAAEALAGDGSKSKVVKKFHDFFEEYAPDPGLKRRRDDMYDMRSKIIHGSRLMHLDQDIAFGWDPPRLNEQELNWELWGLTQTAARNWIKNQPINEESPCYFRVVRHTLDKQGRLAERAVLSGQHRTPDEAQAALELEATKNLPWGFDPDNENWWITDNAGKKHFLMIDPL